MTEEEKLAFIKQQADAANHRVTIDLSSGSGLSKIPTNEHLVPDTIKNPKLEIPKEMERHQPDLKRIPTVQDPAQLDEVLAKMNAGMASSTQVEDTAPVADALKPDPEIEFNDPPKMDVIPSDVTEDKPLTRQNAKKFVAVSTSGPTPESMKEVDLGAIVPKHIPTEEELKSKDDKVWDDLDKAVDRVKDEITELHDGIVQRQYEEKLAMESGQPIPGVGVVKPTDSANMPNAAEIDKLFTEHDEDSVQVDDAILAGTSSNKVGINIDSSNVTEEPETEIKEDVDRVDVELDEKTAPPEPEVNINIRHVEMSGEDIFATSDEGDNDKDEAPAVIEPNAVETSDKEFEQLTPEEQQETVNVIFENMKATAREKINPISQSYNLKAFKIAVKPVDVTSVMKLSVQSSTVADWIEYTAGKSISVRALSGPDIIKLNPQNSNRNTLNTLRDMYRIVYDHVVDANKPTFEFWLKRTLYADLDHYYFALYMATFSGSNFFQTLCPNTKCNNVFINDFKFEEMIKYKDDTVKTRVANILAHDTTSNTDCYEAELHQVSNKYAVSIREPSIWSAVIENASLTDTFRDKYEKFINLLTYVEGFYLIDPATKVLTPINLKPDPNDQTKSYANKITICHDILRTLSPDEYQHLVDIIGTMERRASDVSYIKPSITCPKCGEIIPADEDLTAQQLLFMRHQLGIYASL